MNGKLYFTRQGLAKLQKETEELEARLKELQAQTAHVAEVGGDLWHDNASYDLLVIDIRGMDRRVSDAHQQLSQAVLIEPPTDFDRVAVGTRVRIMQDQEEMTLEIVGFGESDPDHDKLAYNTPLALAIMGKQKGEVISRTGAGKRIEIRILEISKGGENVSGA